jgi:indoleamine 2,3-dioxygenase
VRCLPKWDSCLSSIYLTGSKGAEEAGLPHGITFDNGDPSKPKQYVKYCGGSNAQSSLFQFFDIILSIAHQSSHTGFFREMRQYMPPAHARFLKDVASTANLRDFAQRNGQEERLTGAFDRAIVALKTFREIHMEIVKDYVIIPKMKQAQVDSQTVDVLSSTPPGTKAEDGAADHGVCLKRTGGTPLITFLSQARDETSMTAVQPKHRRQLLQKREDICQIGRDVVPLQDVKL